MPEPPHPKLNRPILAGSARAPARALHGYAELEATSNYTFLTGGSHPEELVQQAAALGHAAIAITDTNTLAGIVRAHVAAKDVGIQCIVGCRLLLRSCADASGWPTCEVLVYPSDRAAYGRLCKLLTLGKRRAPKGECWLTLDDLAAHQAGLLAIAVPPADLRALTIDHGYERTLASLTAIFDDDRLSLAMHRPFDPYDEARLEALARLSADSGVPLVATGAVLYHAPERRPLQDVLTCIRLGTTIDRAGVLASGQCRASPQAAERDGPAVCVCTTGARAQRRDCRASTWILARPAQVPVPARGDAAGHDGDRAPPNARRTRGPRALPGGSANQGSARDRARALAH